MAAPLILCKYYFSDEKKHTHISLKKANVGMEIGTTVNKFRAISSIQRGYTHRTSNPSNPLMNMVS